MAKVKYMVREYSPTENMPGVHGFYAQAKTDNVITNRELARKIEARGISRASEIKMILEEAAKVILEEVGENNRVQLETGDGVLVSIYPKVQGSISDADVLANPAKYEGKSVATEDMLTADMLQWSLGAQVGTKYSRQFDLGKQAMKVDYTPSATTATDEEPDTPSNPSNPPTGGDTPGGDNGGDLGE